VRRYAPSTSASTAYLAGARALRYSDEKVANRVISGFWQREWLLNDGQIQNPSAQSYIAARSTTVPRGFGFVHHSRTVSVAPCQTLVSRFATFSSLYAEPQTLPGCWEAFLVCCVVPAWGSASARRLRLRRDTRCCVSVESSRASPPRMPREDGLTHPAATSRSNLASALDPLSRWRHSLPRAHATNLMLAPAGAYRASQCVALGAVQVTVTATTALFSSGPVLLSCSVHPGTAQPPASAAARCCGGGSLSPPAASALSQLISSDTSACTGT
jgi:hypothetical protein